MAKKSRIECKCDSCVHKGKEELGLPYCNEERRYIDKDFINCWGCRYYKAKYLDLLEGGNSNE